MAVYYKPQSPIQSGEDFIYPVTTADQVMVDEDTRLNAVGVYLKNIDNSTDTTVYGNNATTLGGVAAEDYALKTDTAPDSSKLGGKAPEYYIQPRNLLDNSDFTNPVNQRAITSADVSAWTYFIDRWKVEDDTLTISVETDGIHLTASSRAWLSQWLQMSDSDVGKAFTLACGLSDGSIIVESGTMPDNVSVWTEFITGSNDTVQIRSACFDNRKITVGINPKSNIVLKWAALYEGSYTADTLPPYVPKGYAAELAECDLYYRPLGDNVMSVIGMTSSDGGVALFKSIRPMMDGSVPTIINNGTLYVRVNGVDYTATNVRIFKSDKSGVEMLADVSGAPSKQAATIHGSALLALSRDL